MKVDPADVERLLELVLTRNKLTPLQFVQQRLGKDNQLPEDICNAIAMATSTKGATKYGSREGLIEYLADLGVELPKVPSGNKIMAAIKPYGRTKEDQLHLEWLQVRETLNDEDDDADDEEEGIDD